MTHMMTGRLWSRYSPQFSFRKLGVAVVALCVLSVTSGQRAQALSPVNPGAAAASKALAGGRTIEVHGHGGSFGGHGFGNSASVHGAVAPVGGGVHLGGPGFVHPHRFGRVFVGGVYYDDYPYDGAYYDYPYGDNPAYAAGPGCRIVPTVYGPRRICRTRAGRHHHVHRRHHYRRHRHHRA